jgi:chromosome segregation ATPase
MLQEQKLLQRDLQQLKSSRDEDKATQTADAQKYLATQKQLSREQKLLQEASSRVRELEMTLSQTEKELESVKLDLQVEIDELQAALRQEKQRSNNMKTKWAALADSKQVLQKAHERLQRKNQELLDAVETAEEQQRQLADDKKKLRARDESATMQHLKQQHEESMEIAQAAVSAAERREASLRQKFDDLQKNYQTVVKEKEALREQLAQSEQQVVVMMETQKVQKANANEMQTQAQVDAATPKPNAASESPSWREQGQQEVPTNAKSLHTESQVDIPTVQKSNALPKSSASRQRGSAEKTTTTSERIRIMAATLVRPGRIGDTILQQKALNEDKTTAKWRRFVKRLLPRLPFRVVRR